MTLSTYEYICPNCGNSCIEYELKCSRFYYDINCTCCEGSKHTEQVTHCMLCVPDKPSDAKLLKKLERTGKLPKKLFK